MMERFRYPTLEEILAYERRARCARAEYFSHLIGSAARRLRTRLGIGAVRTAPAASRCA